MSNLSDLVESLKRYVAPPGTFRDVFPDTTDDDLIGSLGDAFAESQLDGFFLGTGAPTLDLDDGEITPDISSGAGALIVLWAAYNIALTQLSNIKSRQRYEAKGLIYETEQAASVLTELLKTLRARKQSIVDYARTYGNTANAAGAVFAMADQYFIRAVGGHGVSSLDHAYDYAALSDSPYGF